MPQGTRERIGRAAVAGLGVVLCSGLVGCLGDSGPKKSSLPTKVDNSQWKTTVSPPPGQVGANQPTRPVGTTPPGQSVGLPPGANPYSTQPQQNSPGVVGAPVRQGNPAAMTTYPTSGSGFVPPVTPNPSGLQPAGGTMSQYPGNAMTPPRGVSQEPVAVTAGFSRAADQRTQTLLDMPTPPPAPAAGAPSVSPASPVNTPTAAFPSAPPGPIAPNP